jgi:hypothetical protein
MSYTQENLKGKKRTELKKIAKQIALTKSEIKGNEGALESTRKRNQNELIQTLNDMFAQKYKKYKIFSEDDFKVYKKDDDLITYILELQDLPKLTEKEYEQGGATSVGSGRSKRAKQSDEILKKVKKLSDQPASEESVRRLEKEVDLLDEIEKEDPSDENKARIKEVGELTLEKVGELYNKEKKKPELVEPLIKLFDKISKLTPNVEIDETELLDSKEELETIAKKNKLTQSEMGKLAMEARKMREGAAAQVKDPASGMEVKMAPSEVKKAPSGQLVSSGKGAGKKAKEEKEEEKEELEQKEEPFIPKPVVGTDYRGSKEMFVKPEQKPLEPFGGLQSQNEVEAPYLSTKSDKAIGDVRQVGFIGAQDQLAKVEDVTMEPSERSKSLKRFTNFRWVQSVQNSDLGYASPFQRMDDIDDRRRFGKCFMHANKMPKDADTQDELDKAKGFNTYSLVPSFDMHSRMQPATPLSFINSTSKFARKLTKDEMEPINQGKRNVNNVKNHLEFPSLLFNDDPLMRIKDKYKNNIVC